MRNRQFLLAAALVLLVQGASPAVAASAPQQTWDGLVEINSPRMDAAFLLPGADFRSYTKVMLDQPEVAFRKNWMRNMNTGMSHRVTDSDAKKILTTVQSNTMDIFA